MESASNADDDYKEAIGDELWMLDQLASDAKPHTIVGLYSIVELNSMKMLGWRWSQDEISKYHLYRIKDLKRLLRDEFDFDLVSLTHFKDVDALRKVNNLIKHELDAST